MSISLRWLSLRRAALPLAALWACLCVTSAVAVDGVSFSDPTSLVDSKNALLMDTYADREQAKPGETFTLALRISPAKGQKADGEAWEFHTYGTQLTGNANYVATAMAMDPAEGVTWDTISFPEGINKPDTGGDMFVLYGQNVATIQGTLDPTAMPGPRTFSAQIMVSACTEDFCLAPSQVKLEWPLEVVAADAPVSGSTKTTDELQAQIPIDYSRFTVPGVAAADAEPGARPGGERSGGYDWEKVDLSGSGGDRSFWALLGLALLGGLILNIMPCVLPVVSIKVIELVRSVEQDPRHVINHGLVFSAGIIATFLVGAIIIAIIQAAGTELGWGSLFQSSEFVMAMAILIFAFGLSMAGVYTIKPPQALTAGAEHLAEKEGYGGSFFKGVLATVLGTPCVGPFLGPALGYAFTKTWKETLIIFLMVGVGMAIPYLAMLPLVTRLGRRQRGELSRKLQESRGWLTDFERVMSFALFGTVVYLLSIVGGGMGVPAVIWTLAMLCGVGFAMWLWGRLVVSGPRALRLGLLIVPALLLFSIWFGYVKVKASTVMQVGESPSPMTHGGAPNDLPWEEFSLAEFDRHFAGGETVLVDFTADWCPNCKVNEAVALNVAETQQLVDELGIITLVADQTLPSEEITYALRALQRSAIPLTAIFPASDPYSPILLDGLFTAEQVQEQLRLAAQGN